LAIIESTSRLIELNMTKQLKILILEDSAIEAEMVQRFLKKQHHGYQFHLAKDQDSFLLALEQFRPDVILADNSLPQFDATEALKIVRQQASYIPFIMVTGTVSEEFAAGIIKSGADDFILKDRLARLPAAIEAALRQQQTEIEKKALEQEILDQKIQEQKRITRAILSAQEQERNRIGQELHDNICQILSTAKLYIEVAREDRPELNELVGYPIQLIENSISEIRLLSKRSVTPLKNIDLKELAQVLVTNLANTTPLKTNFTYDITDRAIDDGLKLNIYRIIQEQLGNIVKHAAAKNVNLSITAAGDFINVVITDDGKGFDLNKKRTGIGISNMINRIESFNGQIQIETSPGHGCTVQIRLPC
jgi:signal transduction histidine kinase